MNSLLRGMLFPVSHTRGQPRSSRALVACLVGLAIFTAADLWSKAWAAEALSQPTQQAPTAACTPDERGH